MKFFRLEYWSGLPFPPLGDFPNPGIEPRSPTLQAGSLPSESPGNTKLPRKPSDQFINIQLHFLASVAMLSLILYAF